jgi:hypothetical protein
MGADTLLPDRKTQKYRQEQLPNKEKLKNNVNKCFLIDRSYLPVV